MNITANILSLRNALPSKVTLVAVSKNKPVSDILEAYRAGQRDFGENKVKELIAKLPQLPVDIRWHLIGHLQSNKVKFITTFIHLIHSVDSYKLLREINRESARQQRNTRCLLQFHIATEESKYGFDRQEALQMLGDPDFDKMQYIQVCGVMGMASFTDKEQIIREEFRELRQIFTMLKSQFFRNNESFREISMGMSGDYQLALEEGSTMVRIGTSIFGKRN